MKVEILEEYYTSFGKTLIVKNENPIATGDIIENEKGEKYKVRKILMPNNPDFLGKTAVVI